MVQRVADLLREVFGIDIRCLAVFRMVIALIVLLDLALRLRFIGENYTDDGVFPRELVSAPDCYMSLQMLDGSFGFQVAHFIAAGIGGLMLLVGYRTRVATIICWLLTMSLHARNGFLLDAGDDLLRSLLLWSLFLPLGLRYSVDSRTRAERNEGVVLSPATVALLLQFGCVYFFAGWFKSTSEWTSGIAIERVLAQTLWTRPAGDALRQYPQLLSCLTPTVVWFEVIAPICLFIPVHTRRIRMFVIPAFWAFQLGLAATIQLHIFPLVTAAATIPFLSSLYSADENRGRAVNAAARLRKATRLGKIAWFSLPILLGASTMALQVANLGKISLPMGERAASLVGWNPIWSMYATVSGFSYRLSAEATLADGETIDLVESEVTNEDRRRGQVLHQTYRFKYFLESAMGAGPDIPNRYLAWLVYQWNRTHPPERGVENAKIMISSNAISPPGPTRTSVLAEMIFFKPGD